MNINQNVLTPKTEMLLVILILIIMMAVLISQIPVISLPDAFGFDFPQILSPQFGESLAAETEKTGGLLRL